MIEGWKAGLAAGVLAACDRAKAGPTAPAKGLALARVCYPGFVADGGGMQ